ncbi:MAG: ABC-type uncharacterized transport system [candidate division BRC1 bacterium ADurb.BinA292]|nr:MAG: ABC-type uncharacterized transport system [candidate division BRC1 bacterium ADurb.BinA292]
MHDKTLKIWFRTLPVIGVLFVIAGFGWAIRQAAVDPVVYTLVGIGLALFLTLFAKAELANLKYYLHVVVYSLLVFILCAIVYLAIRQYDKQADLTEQNLYTLSDQSRQVLDQLKEPVEIVFFFSTDQPFRDIMRLYGDASDQIQFKVIDPIKDPVAAMRYGENIRTGEVVIRKVPEKGEGTPAPAAETKQKRISATEFGQGFTQMGVQAENALTNAIIEVTRAETIKLYFLEGHGEVSYDEAPMPQPGQRSSVASLSALRKFLEDRGMETARLNLITSGLVPEDATMVVIAGPAGDLLPPEISALRDYLTQRYGKLMVLLDVPQENFALRLPNLLGLLEEYGVSSPDEVIIDLANPFSPVQPIVQDYAEDHPITRDLRQAMMLSISRPVVSRMQGGGQWQVTELMRTSPSSFSKDLQEVVANERITPPPRSEMQPQTLAVAVSPRTPPQMPNMPPLEEPEGARLVVFGTSEFVQNSTLTQSNVAVNLMLNTINWLAEQEDVIAIPPRQLEGTPIILTPQQLRVIFVLAVILLPGALFFGGVSYSIARRRR